MPVSHAGRPLRDRQPPFHLPASSLHGRYSLLPYYGPARLSTRTLLTLRLSLSNGPANSRPRRAERLPKLNPFGLRGCDAEQSGGVRDGQPSRIVTTTFHSDLARAGEAEQRPISGLRSSPPSPARSGASDSRNRRICVGLQPYAVPCFIGTFWLFLIT
jgi:hypothetical protein